MFGEAIISFDSGILSKLISTNKIEEAKKYVNEYFIKLDSPSGVLMWLAYEKRIIMLSNDDVKKSYINQEFKLQHWFFNENPIYYDSKRISRL